MLTEQELQEQELRKETQAVIDETRQLIMSLQQISNRLLKKVSPNDRQLVYTEMNGTVWYLPSGGSFSVE